MAETPLPLEVLDAGKVEREIRADVDDLQKAKRLMGAVVRNLIVYERLLPWGEQFCRRGRANVMCLSDIEIAKIAEEVEVNDWGKLFQESVPEEALEGKWDEFRGVYNPCWPENKTGGDCFLQEWPPRLDYRDFQ